LNSDISTCAPGDLSRNEAGEVFKPHGESGERELRAMQHQICEVSPFFPVSNAPHSQQVFPTHGVGVAVGVGAVTVMVAHACPQVPVLGPVQQVKGIPRSVHLMFGLLFVLVTVAQFVTVVTVGPATAVTVALKVNVAV